MLNRLLSIASWLLIFCAYSQNKVELIVSPTSVEVGESFNITITSYVKGDPVFDQFPDSFVPDYTLTQGSKPVMDHNTGNIRIVYFYSLSGVINTEGKYTIGPAYVTSGSKSYYSNEVSMNVSKKVPMKIGKISQTQLKEPAFGVIQTNKTTIYEGEPLLISCKIFAQYDPSHVGNYKSYGIPGTTVKHIIGNPNDFKDRPIRFKGLNFYTFDYDKNIIFPSGIGQYKIEPFEMNVHQGYQSIPIKSNAYAITILPLPENPPVDFNGAVGSFDIKRKLDLTSIKQGDVVKMTVTISGIGNLQNIEEPALNLPQGFMVYGDPAITENYTVGIHGTEGEIVYEYNIEVKTSGKIDLPAASLSFFSPVKKKYIQLKSPTELMSIKKDENYIVHSPKNAVKNKELVVQRSSIKANSELISQDSFFGTTSFWGLSCLPIMAGFFFIFFARSKDDSENKAEIKRQKAEKANLLKAELVAAENLLHSGSDGEFYTHLENALRKAYEIEMQFEEDRLINKTDIISFTKEGELADHLTKVTSIFETCEQLKYGFASTEISRNSVLADLKSIIDQMKNIKW